MFARVVRRALSKQASIATPRARGLASDAQAKEAAYAAYPGIKEPKGAHPYTKEVTPTVRRNNALLAVALFGFVGFIYSTALSKMTGGSLGLGLGSGKDDLEQIIDLETNKSTSKKA